MISAVVPRDLVGVLVGSLALGSLACGSDPGPAEPTPKSDGVTVEAPAKPAEQSTPNPSPNPIVEIDQSDPNDPVLAERELALRNVGRSAFEALKAGDFAKLLELTPIDTGSLRDACPKLPLSDRRELEARFDHCHAAIAWDAVSEAKVFAGKPTGDPALGCEPGIEDYGRLQLFVHMTDATIWRIELFGAVGKDGNAIGINGEVTCATVDEAPVLGAGP